MKKYVFFIFLFLIVFFPSIFFYFISDDYFFISFTSFAQSLSFIPEFNHYTPIFWTTMYLVRVIFGQNPFYYHLLSILVHLTDSILVMKLVKELTKNNFTSFTSMLLFSVFFSNYEVVYWITGLNTSLMVLFYLLALLILSKFISRPNNYYLIGYFVMTFLAILTHEHALTLVPVSFMWIYFFKDKKTSFKKYINIILVLILCILVFLLIRVLNTSTTEIIKIPTVIRFIYSMIKSSLYLLLPLPQIIDAESPKIVIIFFCTYFFYILNWYKKFPKNTKLLIKFCFMWLTLQMLLFCATSLPQARYFYLSSVPSVIILTTLFFSIKNKYVAKIIFIIIVVFNLSFLLVRESEWRQTSEINKKTVEMLRKNLSHTSENQRIIFLDLPDSLKGPPWNAYLFRNGMENVIKYTLGYGIKNIYYTRTLKNDTGLIFQYDYEKKELVKK